MVASHRPAPAPALSGGRLHTEDLVLGAGGGGADTEAQAAANMPAPRDLRKLATSGGGGRMWRVKRKGLGELARSWRTAAPPAHAG